MSWLRLDDGYDTHPKLLELTEQQRWRWTRVLIHCARHRTEGHVKSSVLRELGLGRQTTNLLELGLLEPNGGQGYLVHDWDEFNPPQVPTNELEDKVAQAITANPAASANDIARVLGGNRKSVLEAVKRFRSGTASGTGGSGRGTESGSQGTSQGGSGTGSRAGAGARPVPSPKEPLPSNRPLDAAEGRPDDEPGYTPAELEALAADTLNRMPA